MEQTELKINELLGKGNLLTFLVGSGCSVDAPSNVPNGNKIKEELIKYFCAESEIENILKIEGLKLEFLLATIFENMGDTVKIFDYFELFANPNLQHFFLANCIKKGHYLMTTNFDFLIETALLELDIPKKEIVPIITEKEFINYSNPAELYKRGFKAIYKIHGSTKNIITGAEKQSSLINTINELGFNRVGKSLFQIEPFKRTLLDSVCNGRSLVVMGYSGENDFDIIPTIKALTNIKNIIWINHSKSIQPGNETIYEIKRSNSQPSLRISKDLTKLAEILYDIRRFSNVSKIYLITANVVSIIKNLIQIKPKLSSRSISLSLEDWLKKNIKPPNMFEKVLIASRIYYELGFFNDAMKCSEIMNRFATLADVKSWKSIANEALTKSFLYQQKKLETQKLQLNKDRVKIQVNALTMRSKSLILFANIYFSVEKLPEAIKKFEEVLEIYEKLGYSKDIANCLNRIGDIHYKYKDYNEAVKNYNKALKIYNQLEDLSGKAKSFISIGECFLAQKNYPKARKSYLSALKIHRKLNLLKGKAIILNQMGEITRLQKNYSKATKYAMNAVKLNEELRDWMGKASSLKIIAFIKEDQKDYYEAIKFYNRAADIYEKLGNLSEMANCLMMISKVHKIQGNNSKALMQNERALKLYQQIGDLHGMGNCLFDNASINFNIANYQEALKYYEEVSKLDEKSIDLTQKSISLKNMGLIYQVQGNLSKALIKFEEATKIDDKLENLNDQAISFYRIALIHFDQKNYPNALINFNKSIEIYEKLTDLKGLALCLGSKGDLFRFQKYFPEALNQYKLSLRLSEELGDLSIKAHCLINIGEIYKGQGKLPEASKAYNEALNINKKMGDSRGEAICLNSIGDIFRMQGDYPTALEHCEKALKINEEGEDLSVKAKCLRNIALIKQEQGEYPEALKYYKETLLIFKKYGLFEDSEIRDIEKKIKAIFSSFQKNYIPQKKESIKPDMIKVHPEKDKRKETEDKKLIFSNIIFKVQGNYEKALKYYKEALKKADDLNEKLKYFYAIGEIYQNQGLYKKAVKQFEEALEIAKILENESLKFKLVSKIRELYNKIFNIN